MKQEAKFLPISEYQKRFFLEWTLAPQEILYNVSMVNRITGNLNIPVGIQMEFYDKLNGVTHGSATSEEMK